MIKVLRGWMQRYFSDEEAVVLAVLLFLAFAIVLTLGKMLAPVLAVAGLAYGACKLYDYLEQKQADSLGEAVEARRAALPSGEK